MKNKRSSFLTGVLAIAILQIAVISSRAQIIATNGSTVIINNFDTSDQVYINQNLGYGNTGQFAWANWFGQAFSNVVWDASDAGAPGDNPGSGSMLIQSYFPDGGIGGMYGTQFVVFDGFGAFNPPFNGFGTLLTNVTIVTNFSCDIRFDPISATNANGTFPTVEFGTYGNDTNFNQYDFGTVTLQSTNTNWFHVSIPLAANPIWTNIPSVFVKIFSSLGATGSNVPVFLYVDNLEFQQGTPSAITPPTMGIQKAPAALRIFAQGGQYSRTQIATVDTNQSWVGGSYPVSYSFTLSGYNPNVAVNEFHAFWIPLNYNSGSLNQYSDYSTAANTVRLLITQAAASSETVVAQLAWKTNLLNSNPNNVIATVTNSTMVGTWTVTFSSATDGTLTAPGASPVAFTTIPAAAAATFANPLVYEFGMQPDPTTSIGAYVDVTHAQTVNVATGVPVNSDLTTGTIDTNIWLTGSVSTANGVGLVPVNPVNTPWWVYWTTPDLGFGFGTKADIGNKSIAWKTPNYYANYPTNGPTVLTEGAYKWELVPAAGLPTVDGTSNGVKAATAFFSLQNPAPAQ
ncbi:MAG TPA: hypothetical protein VG077_13725 [Verrucomicrobiae bacterium]|nr:hypothetical protein [Verrucomicrobiae bacterium]